MSETTAPAWDADIALPEPRKNKPVTVGRRIEAGLFLGLLWLMGQMPIERASDFLGKTMRVLGPLVRKVHKRGDANLRLIYPDMTQAERSAILRDCWENVGRTMAEYAHIEELADRVQVENIDALREFTRGGKQAIYFSGHFANWEALGAMLRKEGAQFGSVYRAPNNALVDKKIIELRGKAMTRLQIPKGKRGGRDLLTALKNGYSLTMLVDQKLNDGIEVPLLGYPAMTAPAAARLAKKMGIPLVPLQIIRRPGPRFVVTMHKPIEAGDRSVEEVTAEVNEVLGSFILARPEQWLWFHRRWPAEITPA
ncbi:lysophospholipid acyltransferase family protein [Parvularcula lutaonensis]|uniref:Lysophospholipid acyltransferase family protein n=1 Tax=Parvularcula lutaonensis TaxID=491923 RepID=A0ABV7MBI7_9PROT|nr:lysophospholipid acyltransferase family protein [Parvularcula lutaonensis]GGY39876.1 lipid A biosynthesis lauroyl acyltransferase [Parvularcula lutaonensis]